MQELANGLKESLKDLEKLKQTIMKKINEIGENEQAIRRTTVYPLAKVKPLTINGYPVFQFGYEGMLPVYKNDDYEYISMVRHYYYRATFDTYNYSKFDLPIFKKAVLIFVEYFDNEIIRDLDNRNKKYIQDAIKLTGIIKKDTWKHVWNIDLGFLDKEKSHVQVYVVSQENIVDFLSFLIKNHEKLKEDKPIIKKRSNYEKEFFKEKKEEKEEKIRLENEEKIQKNIDNLLEQFY